MVHSCAGARVSRWPNRLPPSWSAVKLFQLLAVKIAVPPRQPERSCTSQPLHLLLFLLLVILLLPTHAVPPYVHSLQSLFPSSAQFPLSSCRRLLVLLFLHLLLYSKSPSAPSLLGPPFDASPLTPPPSQLPHKASREDELLHTMPGEKFAIKSAKRYAVFGEK